MRSIAFYLEHPTPINPEAPFNQVLSPSAESVISLARELSQLDWHVTIYTACLPGCYGRVTFADARDKASLRGLRDRDVLVSVDQAEIFRRYRAPLKILACYHARTAPVGELDRVIDQYFMLSATQRFYLRQDDPAISADKCVLFGNGVDHELYQQPTFKVPHRIVWTMPPDNGLVHLIAHWQGFKNAIPDLQLQVATQVEEAIRDWRWSSDIRSEWAQLLDEGRHLPDVFYRGFLPPSERARLQKSAGLFVYPCDPTEPSEVWCDAALQNAAAGVPMLLASTDALYEVYGAHRGAAWFIEAPITMTDWIAGVSQLLTIPSVADQAAERARGFAARYSWQNVATAWSEFLVKRQELDRENDLEQTICLAEDTSDRVLSLA